MLSFYTRGMSFVDIAYLKKADLKSGVLTYRRRKTGRRLSIKWEDVYKRQLSARLRRSSTIRMMLSTSPGL